ncbi:Small auxin-up RNA [Olea europaea subsp. europaea]|uniref:Small auxin-up RNA n=1 Tax=Olea europaea subsp. europaea TaxID=158383 RepID=A0A8S0RB75_OLEEU|nr:Small auxin-up RNA [Olea europaea subsp. europaea]
MTTLFGKFGELMKKLRFKNEESERQKGRLRRGFFPVYVGEERKKFWVPVSKSPTLKTVLNHYAEEYNPLEPISMPGITPEMFNRLLAIIKAES